jgi:vacuolar-type H+-ATPase subunit H
MNLCFKGECFSRGRKHDTLKRRCFMGIYDQFDRTIGSDCLQLAGSVDEELFTLISSLIDQNAELVQKLKEFNSRKELADTIVAEAKIEADKILAGARQKALSVIEQTTAFAAKQGLLILEKARESAISLLDEFGSRPKQLKAGPIRRLDANTTELFTSSKVKLHRISSGNNSIL